jgi:phosphotransferase system HPr-like phosphotransfer protein
MRRTIIIPTALVLAALTLSGCAAASYDPTEELVSPQVGSGTEYDSSGSGESAPTDSDATKFDDTAIDREVITTGYVTITVEEPMDAAADAVRITESVGGRVDGRSEYAPVDGDQGSATLTLRIPADALTDTLDKLRELGEVQEVSLYSSDVTMQTQDLDARIRALTASVDRLLGLLATATDTDTLITLETAISDRQAQLESLESERRYLADQVSLSTITLNLQSVASAPVEEPDTFVSGLEAGWNAFVAFFAGLLVALGVLLPWLVFAGIVTLVIILLVRRARRKDEAAGPPTAPAATLATVAKKK